MDDTQLSVNESGSDSDNEISPTISIINHANGSTDTEVAVRYKVTEQEYQTHGLLQYILDAINKLTERINKLEEQSPSDQLMRKERTQITEEMFKIWKEVTDGAPMRTLYEDVQNIEKNEENEYNKVMKLKALFEVQPFETYASARREAHALIRYKAYVQEYQDRINEINSQENLRLVAKCHKLRELITELKNRPDYIMNCIVRKWSNERTTGNIQHFENQISISKSIFDHQNRADTGWTFEVNNEQNWLELKTGDSNRPKFLVSKEGKLCRMVGAKTEERFDRVPRASESELRESGTTLSPV